MAVMLVKTSKWWVNGAVVDTWNTSASKNVSMLLGGIMWGKTTSTGWGNDLRNG